MKFHVDASSYLARWTEWQGRARVRALGAIGQGKKRPNLFVADEVLVGAGESDLIQELIDKYGAKVILWAPVPAGPQRFDQQRPMIAEGAPLPVRLQLPEDLPISDAAARLENITGAGSADDPSMTVSSQGAAALAALVAEHRSAGRRIGLNHVGLPCVVKLPYSSVTEGAESAGNDPFQWPAYTGRARIVQAWQLLESWRQIQSIDTTRPILIGILDAGFDLDSMGTPFVAPGEPESDFGPNPLQMNLTDDAKSRPAGGPNPSTCTGDSPCPWHGNGTAGIAAGTVDDSAGIAGVGGTVAQPVLFRTDISTDQIYYCLKVCQAWGVSVLNMSIEITGAAWFFDGSTWNDNFQFASDHGLIMVASAGNDGSELPDEDIRPATRTPGVITVGALALDNETAAEFSNYGSSVNIWAPGTNIPVGPNQSQPTGSASSGTSVASPIVAGVAAMLRYLDPTIDSPATLKLLTDTSWPGAERVTAGLDAYAAVLKVMGGNLPDNNKPNNTAAAAVELQPNGPDGSLACSIFGISGLSREHDWWKFTAQSFANVKITVEWYKPLANCVVELTADDPDSTVPSDLPPARGVGRATFSGVVPPGTYRLHVSSLDLTAYRPLVWLTPMMLEPDQFEPNDSFDGASDIYFDAPPPATLIKRPPRRWGPGSYDATLHLERNLLTGGFRVNPDYYMLNVPVINVFHIPTVIISRTDAPVDVTLYDSGRNVIATWPAVRSLTIQKELPAETICYLLVDGAQQTRYKIEFQAEVDQSAIPPPLHGPPVYKLPPWWGETLLQIGERVQIYLVQVGIGAQVQTGIAFQRPAEKLGVELTDANGIQVRTGVQKGGRIRVGTEGLAAGNYFLQILREEGKTGSLSLKQLPVD